MLLSFLGKSVLFAQENSSTQNLCRFDTELVVSNEVDPQDSPKCCVVVAAAVAVATVHLLS